MLGSLSFYGLGLALGEVRSFALLKRTARLLGVSQAQLGRLIVSFRRHQKALAFASQLIPSVRLWRLRLAFRRVPTGRQPFLVTTP